MIDVYPGKKYGDEVGALFGLDAGSNGRLIDTRHRFAAFDSELGRNTLLLVGEMAEKLREALRREFKPHDRTGRQDDPSRYDPNYIHTIDTFIVEVEGFHARVVMGGAAVFIQFGTRSHFVGPRDAGALHWVFEGEDEYSMGHNVRGITADDFIGRAMADTDLAGILTTLFSKSYAGSFMGRGIGE